MYSSVLGRVYGYNSDLMVFTLIRATKKTTLNCMSALPVCIVPNVNCKRSQQLRTICTSVTDYTYKFI